MALPVPTKAYLQVSPDTAMLFAPFGCTHPPPPVPPFLLTQNLSPKDIAGSDIMKLKVSRRHMKSLGRKGLNKFLVKALVCTSHSLPFCIASNKGLECWSRCSKSYVWEYRGMCSVVYIAAMIMRLRSACWRGLLTQISPLSAYLAKNWPISRLLVRRWKHLNGSFCGQS